VENSKKKNVPSALLGYLWELSDSDGGIEAPPMVRSVDALTEVLKPFWEMGERNEILIDLLYLEEGEGLEHKLWKPQPQSEIESPENLYQVVRKPWDHDRMGELIAMIEEYEDQVYGLTIKEAHREYREWVEKKLARNSRPETSA
jgi:hypothetical protein